MPMKSVAQKDGLFFFSFILKVVWWVTKQRYNSIMFVDFKILYKEIQ